MSGMGRIGCKTAQVRQSRWLSGIAGGEKTLPLPLREGECFLNLRAMYTPNPQPRCPA